MEFQLAGIQWMMLIAINQAETGKGDVYLQNQIKGGRLETVKVMQEMAQLMNQAYGILVTSPDQLAELFE